MRQEIDWRALPARPSALASAAEELPRARPEAAPARRGRRAHRARRAAARAVGRGGFRSGRPACCAAVARRRGARARGPVGLGAGYWLRGRPWYDPERWLLAIPDGLTVSVTDQPQLALSRDGRLQVAVVTDAHGTDRSAAAPQRRAEPRILLDTDGARGPFFSPDGAWIGFFRPGGLSSSPSPAGRRCGSPRRRTIPRRVLGRGRFHLLLTQCRPAGWRKFPKNGGPDLRGVPISDLARDERTHRWPQAPCQTAAPFCSPATRSASTEFYDDARIEAVRLSRPANAVYSSKVRARRATPPAAISFLRAAAHSSLIALRSAIAHRSRPPRRWSSTGRRD